MPSPRRRCDLGGATAISLPRRRAFQIAQQGGRPLEGADRQEPSSRVSAGPIDQRGPVAAELSLRGGVTLRLFEQTCAREQVMFRQDKTTRPLAMNCHLFPRRLGRARRKAGSIHTPLSRQHLGTSSTYLVRWRTFEVVGALPLGSGKAVVLGDSRKKSEPPCERSADSSNPPASAMNCVCCWHERRSHGCRCSESPYVTDRPVRHAAVPAITSLNRTTPP